MHQLGEDGRFLTESLENNGQHGCEDDVEQQEGYQAHPCRCPCSTSNQSEHTTSSGRTQALIPSWNCWMTEGIAHCNWRYEQILQYVGIWLEMATSDPVQIDAFAMVCAVGFKKNMNASRPSEHPPARGEHVKTFRWEYKTSS